MRKEDKKNIKPISPIKKKVRSALYSKKKISILAAWKDKHVILINILAKDVQEQIKGRTKVAFTFMGMFVMVVEAKSKCCWTKMLSLVARCLPARTLCTSLVSREEI